VKVRPRVAAPTRTPRAGRQQVCRRPDRATRHSRVIGRALRTRFTCSISLNAIGGHSLRRQGRPYASCRRIPARAVSSTWPAASRGPGSLGLRTSQKFRGRDPRYPKISSCCCGNPIYGGPIDRWDVGWCWEACRGCRLRRGSGHCPLSSLPSGVVHRADQIVSRDRFEAGSASQRSGESRPPPQRAARRR
jgi:hypothetical protein